MYKSENMEITHLGHSSFKLRGKNASLVTDPYDPIFVGIKFPKVEADIVTVSHQHKDHNFTQAVGGNPLVIVGPGEYEVKGVKIIGVSSYHDDVKGEKRGNNTVYHVEMDGVSIVHCGDLGHKFDDKEMELLNGTDVLILPVGGYYTIDAQTATGVVTQLEPKIVVPMHYLTAKMTKAEYVNLAGVDMFLKAIGKPDLTAVPKLLVSSGKLPVEQTVVVLE